MSPKLGYLAWHADAERRMEAGEKQHYCRRCRRYYWKHEWKDSTIHLCDNNKREPY